MKRFAIYFHSKKNFKNPSTWGKEQIDNTVTIDELVQAARFGGCEGVGILVKKSDQLVITELKWLVK